MRMTAVRCRLHRKMLTTSGKRALAAAMIRASDRAVPAALAAAMLDATAAAVLRVAGVEARRDVRSVRRCWGDR